MAVNQDAAGLGMQSEGLSPVSQPRCCLSGEYLRHEFAQAVLGCAVKAGHCLCRDHGVEHSFFLCLSHSAEQDVDLALSLIHI